jgi:hypothetical protein
MSTNVLNDKGSKNEQKSVFYPFMLILEEFMEEGKKEYLKNKNTTNKKENIKNLALKK